MNLSRLWQKIQIPVRSIIPYVLQRLVSALITLFVVTLLLFSLTMFSTPAERALLHWPESSHLRPGATTDVEAMVERLIVEYGLDQPFTVQYGNWVKGVLAGDWGYSTTSKEYVLPVLIQLTPATAELALYSVLLFLPLGLISGAIAGAKQGSWRDFIFRLSAFVATSIPPFILAIVLLAIFYVGVYWFPPGRLSDINRLYVTSDAFTTYTGLLTIDGYLNQRPDISEDALRHLVLPVITLSLYHWATLSRVTRVAVAEEMGKDYVLAARARGLPEKWVLWRHAMRAALAPALNSTMLSAASLFTGIFVVESIYNYGGVSKLVIKALTYTPDIAAALGFTIYSVLVVLLFMTVLDVLQGLLDPRLREGQGVL